MLPDRPTQMRDEHYGDDVPCPGGNTNVSIEQVAGRSCLANELGSEEMLAVLKQGPPTTGSEDRMRTPAWRCVGRPPNVREPRSAVARTRWR